MFNIAIIGAGPAGATLARLLLTSSISSDVKVTIFEKDASRHSRFFLGGTLDLHPKTGLAALKKANLWDEFVNGEKLQTDHMPGNHFSMMKAPYVNQLSDFVRRAMA